MRRFFRNAILFGLPFIVYALFIVLIDPFRRFELGDAIPNRSRATVAPVVDNALWKVGMIERTRGENILVGGSKLALLTAPMIKQFTDIEYQDLSVGGASANDIIDLFWHAAQKASLKRVVISINVETFNRRTNRDSVSGAVMTWKNPLLYLSNRGVMLASANLFRGTYLGGKLMTAVPPMSKDEFWREQMGYGATRNFFEFEFDETAFLKMGGIARYCQEHAIELKFLILPNHADVHERMRAFGVEPEWRRFPSRVVALGETYDFDGDDDITRDRDEFLDPFHFGPSIARTISRKVFSQPRASGH
jgi:hypothetical protein